MPSKPAMKSSAYADLEKRFHRLSALSDSASILHWDMATMMPSGGAEGRGEQLAALRALQHELLTAPEVEDWLDSAEEDHGKLDPWQGANVREMRRLYTDAVAVPVDLVEALSKACSHCEMVWREARAANDFPRVAPLLEEVLALTVETGRCKAEKLACSPYDALLAQYEPAVTSAQIDTVFADLEAFLPDFLDRVLTRQSRFSRAVLQGPFPVKAQKDLSERIMGLLGFDFTHGRLDESAHPFCGGTADDVRLTTRYHDDDFLKALTGTVHETGHALYEQGLPIAWRGQPVGLALGMASHESQSLLMEKQLFGSKAFLDFAAPLIRQAFDATEKDENWSADSLLRLVSHVERGFIRIEADEVSYPLHVTLRYRLERAMIEGDLRIADLPGAWNDEMRRLLGIVPPNDSMGCLQDIHWYDGAWGYFPTYTLGALMAAQLFEAAGEQIDHLADSIRGGDFAPLLEWLRTNVHGYGARDPMPVMLERATGKPLRADSYKAHLTRRYLDE